MHHPSVEIATPACVGNRKHQRSGWEEPRRPPMWKCRHHSAVSLKIESWFARMQNHQALRWPRHLCRRSSPFVRKIDRAPANSPHQIPSHRPAIAKQRWARLARFAAKPGERAGIVRVAVENQFPARFGLRIIAGFKIRIAQPIRGLITNRRNKITIDNSPQRDQIIRRCFHRHPREHPRLRRCCPCHSSPRPATSSGPWHH